MYLMYLSMFSIRVKRFLKKTEVDKTQTLKLHDNFGADQ